MIELLDNPLIDKKEYKILKLRKEDIYSGSLILVNKYNKFVGNNIKLVDVDKSYLYIYNDTSIYINEVMNKPLNNLIDAIDGRKKMVAVSGFRSEEEQRDIYDKSIFENGLEFTKKYVAKPMESEHQTGFAIDLGEVVDDIDFICPLFPDEGICKKFKDLASSYGFIMRYRFDKEEITGISEEKWHFRYVSRPHAEIINNYNYCLEEYIEFIRNFDFDNRYLFITNNGEKVEVYFVKYKGKDMEIKIPIDKKYDISGNNIDGFIVTVWE